MNSEPCERLLGASLGTYELHREADGRYRGEGFEARYVAVFGWGARWRGISPWTWFFVAPSGDRWVWRPSFKWPEIGVIEVPHGVEGDRLILTFTREVQPDSPFSVLIGAVPPEFAMAIADGWSRSRGEKEEP